MVYTKKQLSPSKHRKSLVIVFVVSVLSFAFSGDFITTRTGVSYLDVLSRRLATNEDQAQGEEKKIEETSSEINYEGLGFTKDDLPAWLREYVEWHHRVRSKKDGGEIKYLVLAKGLGGLADKLRGVPYWLWLAARHKRVFLMEDWGSPCEFDEFFQPSLIDWKAPPGLLTNTTGGVKLLGGTIGNLTDYGYTGVEDKDIIENDDVKVLRVYTNSLVFNKFLANVYRDAHEERKIFPYIYQSLFRLSDQVQKLLDETKEKLGLLNRDYIAFHMRLRYPGSSAVITKTGKEDYEGFDHISPAMEKEMVRIGEHALHCTKQAYYDNSKSKSNNDVPVYVASDTSHALQLLKQNHSEIQYLHTDDERSHTDHINIPWSKVECSAYYPAVIDLWLLSGAKCIGFGVGGYGSTSLMMSSHFDCWSIHQKSLQLYIGDTPFFKSPQTNEFPECLIENQAVI